MTRIGNARRDFRCRTPGCRCWLQFFMRRNVTTYQATCDTGAGYGCGAEYEVSYKLGDRNWPMGRGFIQQVKAGSL